MAARLRAAPPPSSDEEKQVAAAEEDGGRPRVCPRSSSSAHRLLHSEAGRGVDGEDFVQAVAPARWHLQHQHAHGQIMFGLICRCWCNGAGRDNDWKCPNCDNTNFAFHAVCNMRKCNTPRPDNQLPFFERCRLIEDEIIRPCQCERKQFESDAKSNPIYKYDMELFSARRKDFWLLLMAKRVLKKFISSPCHDVDGLIFQVTSHEE